MDIKKFLSTAFFLDKDIEILEERIYRLRELSTNVSSIIMQEKNSQQHKKDKMGDLIADILELEDSYLEKIALLVKYKTTIQELLDIIVIKEQKIIMELRYLDFYTWENIAIKANYSLRHVYTLHRKAVKFLENNNMVA